MKPIVTNGQESGATMASTQTFGWGLLCVALTCASMTGCAAESSSGSGITFRQQGIPTPAFLSGEIDIETLFYSSVDIHGPNEDSLLLSSPLKDNVTRELELGGARVYARQEQCYDGGLLCNTVTLGIRMDGFIPSPEIPACGEGRYNSEGRQLCIADNGYTEISQVPGIEWDLTGDATLGTTGDFHQLWTSSMSASQQQGGGLGGALHTVGYYLASNVAGPTAAQVLPPPEHPLVPNHFFARIPGTYDLSDFCDTALKEENRCSAQDFIRAEEKLFGMRTNQDPEDYCADLDVIIELDLALFDTITRVPVARLQTGNGTFADFTVRMYSNGSRIPTDFPVLGCTLNTFQINSATYGRDLGVGLVEGLVTSEEQAELPPPPAAIEVSIADVTPVCADHSHTGACYSHCSELASTLAPSQQHGARTACFSGCASCDFEAEPDTTPSGPSAISHVSSMWNRVVRVFAGQTQPVYTQVKERNSDDGVGEIVLLPSSAKIESVSNDEVEVSLDNGLITVVDAPDDEYDTTVSIVTEGVNNNQPQTIRLVGSQRFFAAGDGAPAWISSTGNGPAGSNSMPAAQLDGCESEVAGLDCGYHGMSCTEKGDGFLPYDGAPEQAQGEHWRGAWDPRWETAVTQVCRHTQCNESTAKNNAECQQGAESAWIWQTFTLSPINAAACGSQDGKWDASACDSATN